jgi:hypothetical protein
MLCADCFARNKNHKQRILMKQRLHFLKRLSVLFMFLGLMAMPGVGWGQYSGTGTFTKITSLIDLTDGYYVILNETDAFVMTNGRSGSATTGYFVSASITVSNSTISDPSSSNVWKIEVNGGGRTIYNEGIEKYVGWSSGNSASIEDAPANTNRWTFTYASNKFTVKNVAEPLRQLSYNSGSPRFAAYGNDGQQELQFYKMAESSSNPTITVNPSTLSGFTYVLGSGPSAEQSFTISGANLTNNISLAPPTNYEISTTTGGSFAATNPVTLNHTGGTVASTTIYVRVSPMF